MAFYQNALLRSNIPLKLDLPGHSSSASRLTALLYQLTASIYNMGNMQIKSFEPADAGALLPTYNSAHPENMLDARALSRRLESVTASGGFTFLMRDQREVAGYAVVTPVPGLAGIVELEGFVTPERRRQGLGSLLLEHLLHKLRGKRVTQISCGFSSLDSPAAYFLRRHHFFIEHEEIVLRHPDLGHLPAIPISDPQVTLKRFKRSKAITHFLELYEQSFGEQPWYQPYDYEEVDNTLAEAGDLVFLRNGEMLVGFVWMRRGDGDMGEIEPIGVIQSCHGKGYGRLLMLTALHKLSSRGCSQAKIGLWRRNTVALRLYRSVGFQPSGSMTYLAYNLQDA